MISQQTIAVKRDIRAENLAAAEAFRSWATRQGMLIVRLVSSPGSGKTSLLVETTKRLGVKPMAVLVGDVETNRDAQRLSPLAPTVQMTTGGACHLEFPLIETAFHDLPSQAFDFLFIEDVGNLICPASHDLGEHLRIVLLSTTEGDDKPGKYPKMFRTSQAAVLSKIDLLPYVPFSLLDAQRDAQLIQPDLTFLPVSTTTGQGLEEWLTYLVMQRSALLNKLLISQPMER